jgi:hypothetical protein
MENLSRPQIKGPESGRPKGMMEAGKVYLQDLSEGQNKSKKIRLEMKQATKDEIASKFFTKNDGEGANQKSALIAMVEESGISWETLGDLTKEDAISREDIRQITNEYLRVMRSVSSSKNKEFQETRDKFREIINRNIH